MFYIFVGLHLIEDWWDKGQNLISKSLSLSSFLFYLLLFFFFLHRIFAAEMIGGGV
jgi:hypothetical protein